MINTKGTPPTANNNSRNGSAAKSSSGTKKKSGSRISEKISYREESSSTSSENSDEEEEEEDKAASSQDDDTPISSRTRRGASHSHDPRTISLNNKSSTTKRSSQTRLYESKAPKPKNDIISSPNYNKLIVGGITVLVLAVMAAKAMEYGFNQTDDALVTAGKGESFNRFKRDLEAIKEKYPKQTNKVWTMLASQVRKAMSGTATMPGCILLVHSVAAKKTADCLVDSVLTSIHYAMNRGLDTRFDQINAKDLPTDPKEAKSELFQKMTNALEVMHTVALYNLDVLKAESAMALHGICDEGFRSEDSIKPMVLMTITDTRSKPGEYLTAFERAAEVIKSLWQKDLGVDKVHPLISRIASVVINVIPEVTTNTCS
jgi:hypothetical protein